jgi:hypothetical protein
VLKETWDMNCFFMGAFTKAIIYNEPKLSAFRSFKLAFLTSTEVLICSAPKVQRPGPWSTMISSADLNHGTPSQ